MKWIQHIPAHTRQVVWPLLFGLLLFYTGCKSKQEIARSYDYLLKKETPTDTVVTAVVVKPKPVVAPTEVVKKALNEAAGYLGVPYRHGGINKNGIDCSGLAHNSYLAAGVSIPRSTLDQAVIGTEVKRSDLRLGDLVFFSAKSTGKIDHVGMIAKIEGPAVSFIHASTSKGVRYDRLDEGYWRDLYMTARRVSGEK